MAVAALLGRAARRIALDEEQFGLGGVAFLAVGQLAGQRGDVHHPLAPGQFPRLLRRLARGGGVDHLLHDHAAMLGVRSEERTSELQSLMRISYAVFCLKKKRRTNNMSNCQENAKNMRKTASQ